MNTLKTLFTASIVMALMAASALALPPGKGGPRKALATQADFEALKAGDQLVLVCKTSDSIQIIDIKDEKHALQLCKDGEMVHCPECKKEYKVRRGGHPAGKGGQGVKRDVVIVNEDGEVCMFYAKLK
jgi:peroxiredoxin